MSTKIAVVGAGPGGYVAAVRAAQLGADVCVIEKENVGGTCLNWGCIPSKVMKTAAEMLSGLRRGGQFGLQVPAGVTVDMARLMARKREVVSAQIKGIEGLLKRHQISVIKGVATVSGPGRLAVKTSAGQLRTINWDRLILAAGSRPLNIPAFAFDGDRLLSSDDALELTAVPESLTIVGGGVNGCEFASIMAALGSEVTLVEALDRLLPLPSVDQDCSRILAREMRKQNVKVLLNQTVQSVDAHAGGLRVSIGPSPSIKGGPRAAASSSLTCEKVLVCVGRQSNAADLGLETIGLTSDRAGWLTANDRMETSAPSVYAIGDILGPSKIMLAHVASTEGMVAAENAMGLQRAMRYDAVPSAIFTMPEVACVGLTESQAADRGIDVRSDSVSFRVIGKAQAMGQVAGGAKIISAAKTGQVLGVHLIGAHASDLIAEGTLAVQTGRCVEELAATIHAHPTLAEVIRETALKAVDRGLHG